MEKKELMYEGKAKRIYATADEEIVLVAYKDSATAFNGEKKAEINGKGRLNNEISSLLFTMLHECGVPSHFVRRLSETEQLVKKVSIIPLEVIVRNVAAGSFSKRLGVEEGKPLKKPLVEFCLKDDTLGDPLMTEAQIDVLDIADEAEVALLKEKALLINEILIKFFKEIGVKLIDFKLEFGKDSEENILLADEISPDTCRLWDIETNEKLDKDVFRRDLGNLTDAYQTIFERLGGQTTCSK
ncbi:phosphoribosylaminoimidazolesuccinocarboxamide synthase [Bacillus massilinigeriensis]|uniref:phosphoribosylaminoimidazolesuccinocarboxamide synthase n=1 Tax=Bacillus mediterraneensis TaxID=1805474 RepID=UPI0008F84807|nr:phosphoribosylaminoimidazolesuccinocarboxamide synthase [Bacillus mediterraneensis]